MLLAITAFGDVAGSTGALDVKSLVRASSPAVVTVETKDAQGRPIGTASGFLISSNGILVTNHHVVRQAHRLIAYLQNGSSYTVEKVIGFDCDADLVVLQLKVRGVKLPFLRLGHSQGIETGERVIAIGSPIGLPATVSEGIISGTRIEATSKVRFLQTTAAISPGSSGGPLIRQGPEVIGVTTFGLLGGQSLNFAVPSEYIVSVLRKPAPTSLRTAGAQCKNSPFVPRSESRQTITQATDAIDAMNETIGALIDLACRRVARNNEHYNKCISAEIVKVRNLMSYLNKKTKTSADAAMILIECQDSWSRHGALWNFTFFDSCVRSETKQYRLRGYKVK